LTTDVHKPYLTAVDEAFGSGIDYAMLEKIYTRPPNADAATRYSPAECCGARKLTIMGNPDQAHVSTAFAERNNLTMRMSVRRYTRLTNAFSKKLRNQEHAVALHFMWYNFGKIHQTLRITPAMAAGLSDHVWSVEAIAGLLDSNCQGEEIVA
jgi:hypothetical protein